MSSWEGCSDKTLAFKMFFFDDGQLKSKNKLEFGHSHWENSLTQHIPSIQKEWPYSSFLIKPVPRRYIGKFENTLEQLPNFNSGGTLHKQNLSWLQTNRMTLYWSSYLIYMCVVTMFPKLSHARILETFLPVNHLVQGMTDGAETTGWKILLLRICLKEVFLFCTTRWLCRKDGRLHLTPLHLATDTSRCQPSAKPDLMTRQRVNICRESVTEGGCTIVWHFKDAVDMVADSITLSLVADCTALHQKCTKHSSHIGPYRNESLPRELVDWSALFCCFYKQDLNF